jgi:chromate transporter
MKDDSLAFFQVVVLFCSLSLMSIGGGNSVIPEMHRKSVQSYGWLNDQQFADVFAISQAAPGPSVLIVTMIGYQAGNQAGGPLVGILAALGATACMIFPAGVLVYLISSVWARAEKSPIRKAVEHGLAPLTVGLVLATGYVMLRASESDWPSYLLTAVCTLIFTTTKINPLIIVAAAGLIGYLGWV